MEGLAGMLPSPYPDPRCPRGGHRLVVTRGFIRSNSAAHSPGRSLSGGARMHNLQAPTAP